MTKKQKIVLKTFHYSQIGRAQRFIRMNSAKDLNLKKIAQEAGSSTFHFGRLFMSYTGETTFSYLRRIRLLNALKILEEDTECSVTEVALSVGYETPSAFNKVFKSHFKMSPTEYRNLGQAQKDAFIYDLSITPKEKEMPMNLTLKPEFVIRPTTHLLYVEKTGIFQDVAMPTWFELIPLVDKKVNKETITEYLGFSSMDSNGKDEASMFYNAGVAVIAKPTSVPKGLKYKNVSGGKYAKFILVGPTNGVWAALEKIFKILAENKIKLRDGACIENYLSNPEVVPENELITEILVPVL